MPTVRLWIAKDYIKGIPKFVGQGISLLLEDYDIYRLGIFGYLLQDMGMKIDAASNIVNQIMPPDFSIIKQILIVNRKEGILAVPHSNIDDILRVIGKTYGQWENCVVIDFERMRKEIDARIVQFLEE
jgi:hypothetical protein